MSIVAPHPPRGRLGHRRRIGTVAVIGDPAAHLAQHLDTPLGRGLHQEAVAGRVENLGHGEVERCAATGHRPRTGAHRDAEARTSRVAAAHRDDEGVGATDGVRRVGEPPAQQHGVVDAERVQVARADPEHGVGPHLMLLAPGLHRPGVVAKPAPDHLAGREEHRLHRLGTVGVAEEHAVVATTQPVGPRGLLVAPADGQVGDLADGSVVDRPVLDHRPDHGVATSRQHVDERLQPRKVEGPVIARSDTGCGTGGGMFGGHPSSLWANACRGKRTSAFRRKLSTNVWVALGADHGVGETYMVRIRPNLSSAFKCCPSPSRCSSPGASPATTWKPPSSRDTSARGSWRSRPSSRWTPRAWVR